MGMYTEFHLNVELRQDTPDDVVVILQYMVDHDEHKERPRTPDHPLFRMERWKWMLLCDSYYFAADTHSTLSLDYGTYYLCIRCNLKNYEGEIEAFIDWLRPYVAEHRGFSGFLRYEEARDPTLIYLAEAAPHDVTVETLS